MTARRAVLVLNAIVLLLSADLLFLGAVSAQRSAPVKIGALTASWGPSKAIVGLREGLQQLGYREDIDFALGVRSTQGSAVELPAAARQLVRFGADILVADGNGEAAKAAQSAALERIPVVFMGATDPVGRGLVRSLARPGGNVTGIASLEVDLGPKRLEIFRELMPGLKRVMAPYDAAEPAFEQMLAVYRDAARRLGLTLVETPLRNEDEVRAVVAEIRKGQVDGIVSPRSLSLNIPGFMLETAARQAAATMFHDSYFVERGGLVSYAENSAEVGRQAARLVDRIMKGAKPADLPVEQSTKFELFINAKTAKALGLTVPPSLLLRADKVIE
jgi:putative ABC transport system substrate-binding protein